MPGPGGPHGRNAYLTEEEKKFVGTYEESTTVTFYTLIPTSLPGISSKSYKNIPVNEKMVLNKENVLNLENVPATENVEFYAYGRGRFLGKYTRFADAAQAASDCMGFVSVGANDPIWVRANKTGAYFMRDVQNAVKTFEGYRDSFTGESLETEV